MERLEDQISWYGRKSTGNQRWYKALKIVTMTAGVLVPIVTTASWGPPYLAAALGVVIVLSEGLQQINQFQANWISYRWTCEALKHEKFLYLGEAGPYTLSDNPRALLAERVEGLVSQEHAKWVSVQEQASKKAPGSPK